MERGAAHFPVLKDEVLHLLSPRQRRWMLDCTVGTGGHAEALLDAAAGDTQLIGIDVDQGCLRLARERLKRFGDRVRLFHRWACTIHSMHSSPTTNFAIARESILATHVARYR